MNWWLTCMREKYLDFNGRARRMEYWSFTLINLIMNVAFLLNDSWPGNTGQWFQGFYTLFSIAIILPTTAVTVRRLHDTGKSGWWSLIVIIPYIGIIGLLVLMAIDSERGENKYGPNPKMNAVLLQS